MNMPVCLSGGVVLTPDGDLVTADVHVAEGVIAEPSAAAARRSAMARALEEIKHGHPMEQALRTATGRHDDVLGAIERLWKADIVKNPPNKPEEMTRPADLNKE